VRRGRVSVQRQFSVRTVTSRLPPPKGNLRTPARAFIVMAGLDPATQQHSASFLLWVAQPSRIITIRCPGHAAADAVFSTDNASAPARERTYDASGAVRQYQTLNFFKFAVPGARTAMPARGEVPTGRLRTKL
jgi:hypothetical protein